MDAAIRNVLAELEQWASTTPGKTAADPMPPFLEAPHAHRVNRLIDTWVSTPAALPTRIKPPL